MRSDRREFKIGHISDLHLDFYISQKDPKRLEAPIRNYISKILKPEKYDILLLAGDLTHYNQQLFELLTQLKEFANHIMLVPGNHDLYLVNNSQKDKYNLQSENRLDEIRDWCSNEITIYFLEGQVINIDGLKIGGYGNWYDLPTNGLKYQWNEVMNDSNLIYGGSEQSIIMYGYGAVEKQSNWDTQKYRAKNEEYLQNIINERCHILLTHIIPCIRPDSEREFERVGDRNRIFYETDDIDKVKESECEVIVFGHTHEISDFDYEGINFISNGVGYPTEYKNNGIESFNFIISNKNKENDE